VTDEGGGRDPEALEQRPVGQVDAQNAVEMAPRFRRRRGPAAAPARCAIDVASDARVERVEQTEVSAPNPGKRTATPPAIGGSASRSL
jgi:hypothetical protein